MKPPYPDQGNALPRDMAPGVWVVRNLVHLSFGDQAIASTPTEWAVESGLGDREAPPSHNMSMGFGARRLASALGIDTDELLEINRDGLLDVSTSLVEANGEPVAVRFTFCYGIRCVEVLCGMPVRPSADCGAPRARRSADRSAPDRLAAPVQSR